MNGLSTIRSGTLSSRFQPSLIPGDTSQSSTQTSDRWQGQDIPTHSRSAFNIALVRQLKELEIIHAVHQQLQQLQQLQPLDSLARTFLKLLDPLIAYDYACAALVDDDGQTLCPLAVEAHGITACTPNTSRTSMESQHREMRLIAQHWRLGQGVAGWVAQTGQSALIGDITRDARYVMIHPDTRTALCVPLCLGTQVLGILNIEHRQVNAYGAHDLHLLEGLVVPLTVAIHNARLYTQVSEQHQQLQLQTRQLLQVQEIERKHLAMELHDEWMQPLTALQQQLKRNAPELSAGCIQLLEDLIKRVRSRSLDLHPPDLKRGTWRNALQALYARYHTAGLNVDCVHQSVDEAALSAEIALAAYRIVQEALTNVLRHSHTTQANVRIWMDATSLHVQIEDHGCGFAPTASPNTAGIAGMRERARLLGGQCEIYSELGSGTTVHAQWALTTEGQPLPCEGSKPRADRIGIDAQKETG